MIWAARCRVSRLGPSSRHVMVEALEDRRLLSATGYELHKSHPRQFADINANIVVGTLTAKHLNPNPEAYKVQIDWGDKTGIDNTSASVNPAPNLQKATLTANHTYALPGVYRLKETVLFEGVAVAALSEPVRVTLPPGGQVLHGIVGKASPRPLLIGTFAQEPPPGLTVSWGDGSITDGPTVTRSGTRYLLSGNHTYYGKGKYVITIAQKAADGSIGGSPILVASTAKIVDPNSIKTIKGVGVNITDVVAGIAFFQAPAKLVGLPANIGSATASVDWGDGSKSEAFLLGSDVVGTMPFSANHTYAAAGTYTTRTTFKVAGRSIGPVVQTIAVAQNSTGGLNLSAVSGTRFEGVVGTITSTTFADATPAPVLYAGIEWGDGTHSQGVITPLGGGQYQVNGAHIYAAGGNYRVQVTVSEYPVFNPPGQFYPYDDQFVAVNSSVTGYSTMTVAGGSVQLPSPAAQAVALPIPDAFGGQVENAAIAELQNFTADPESPLVYATVDWGDGSPGSSSPTGAVPFTTGLLPTVVNGQYVLDASHTYYSFANGHATPVSGTFNVTVTFLLNDHDDTSQNTVLGTAQTTVNVIANTRGGKDIHANANVPFTANLGSFTADPSLSVSSVAILWGDFTTNSVFGGNQTGDGAPISLISNGSNSSYSVVGSHTYASPGEYVIQIAVTFSGPNSQQISDYNAVMSTASVV